MADSVVLGRFEWILPGTVCTRVLEVLSNAVIEPKNHAKTKRFGSFSTDAYRQAL